MINGSITKQNWSKLAELRYKHKFQIALANWFATLTLSNNVNKEQASEVIYECAKNACLTMQHQIHIWKIDDALNLVISFITNQMHC